MTDFQKRLEVVGVIITSRYGYCPSKLRIMGPEFVTVTTAIDNTGHFLCSFTEISIENKGSLVCSYALHVFLEANIIFKYIDFK